MSTLGDVLDFYREHEKEVELFGSKGIWQRVFETKFQAIGKKICQEEGLVFGDGSAIGKIPHDKALGRLAEIEFQKLKAWVKETTT